MATLILTAGRWVLWLWGSWLIWQRDGWALATLSVLAMMMVEQALARARTLAAQVARLRGQVDALVVFRDRHDEGGRVASWPRH